MLCGVPKTPVMLIRHRENNTYLLSSVTRYELMQVLFLALILTQTLSNAEPATYSVEFSDTSLEFEYPKKQCHETNIHNLTYPRVYFPNEFRKVKIMLIGKQHLSIVRSRNISQGFAELLTSPTGQRTQQAIDDTVQYRESAGILNIFVRGWQEKSVTHAAVFPLVAVLIAAAVAAAILIVIFVASCYHTQSQCGHYILPPVELPPEMTELNELTLSAFMAPDSSLSNTSYEETMEYPSPIEVTSAQNDDYDSGGAVSGRGGGGGSGIGSPSIPLSLTIAIVCCCCCCFGGVAVAAAGGGGGASSGLGVSGSFLDCYRQTASSMSLAKAAAVLIKLPTSLKLDSLEVFVQDPQSSVNLDDWTADGTWATPVRVFDAPDLPSDFAHAVAASQLDDACLDAAECQVAKGQGRLGCRPTTKEVGRAGGSSDRCLCIRGFEFYAPSGSCVDIDECSASRNPCSELAVCTNTVGFYRCLCRPGYYGNGKVCRECSRECPSGQFLVAECTPHRDIVCQDAVRPLSKEDNRLKDEDFKPVSEAEAATFKSVHSNNLIAEKSLLKWRSHTVPLSGNGVTKQFVWAGSHPDLEVRLWVKDANLIPTYIDGNKKRADGRDASDNEFMSHLISYYSRKWQHLKAPRVYSSIMKNYCRQPVPLHYKVTLRRKKRVFSELHRISCSSPVEIDGIVYTCPPEYLPDDYYISRKLTSPCYKQNTLYTKYSRLGNYNPYSVSDLKLGVKLRRNSPNVLYCGWTTDLLSKLFNMTTEPERTATPAFDEAGLEPCQDFAANCLACRAEKFDNCDSRRNESWCSADCYGTQFCRDYYTEKCQTAKSSCGIGDVDEYSLTPIFDGLNPEEIGRSESRAENQSVRFQCHLHLQEPKNLFTAGYQILLRSGSSTWTGPAIESTTVQDSVVSLGNGGALRVSGTTALGFNRTVLLPDQLLLVGDHPLTAAAESTSASSAQLRLKRFESISLNSSVWWHSVVKSNSDGLFSAEVQVRRPFSVSTATWRGGDGSAGCRMNASELLRPGPASLFVRDEPSWPPAAPPIRRADGGFAYSLPPAAGDASAAPAAVHFELLANESSLLRDYFCSNSDLGDNVLLQTPEGQLEPGTGLADHPDGGVGIGRWNLSITGFVLSTPAYLSVQVKDVANRALLFRQDWIVRGPENRFQAEFHFSFQAPSASSSSAASSAIPDADIEVDVDDCKQRSRIHLSRLRLQRSEDRKKQKKKQTKVSSFPSLASAGLSAASMFLPLLGGLGLAYLLLLGLLLLVRVCCRSRPPAAASAATVAAVRQQVLEQQLDLQQQQERRQYRSNKLPWQRKAAALIYTTGRICYCLCFSFSAVAAIALALTDSSYSAASRPPPAASSEPTTAWGGAALSVELDRLERIANSELNRQLRHLVDMRAACDRVLSSGLADLAKDFAAAVDKQALARFVGDKSIRRQLERRLASEHAAFTAEVDGYLADQLDRLQGRIERRYDSYGDRVRAAYANPWLAFPLGIFNRSHFFVESLYGFQQRPSLLRKRDVDFMTFLEDTTAEEMHLLPTLLWNKFNQMVPRYGNLKFSSPSLNLAAISPQASSLPESPLGDSHRYFSSNDDSPVAATDGSTKPNSSAESNSDSKKSSATAWDPIVRLRLLLLALDLLLLVYRVHRTVATVRQICYGRIAIALAAPAARTKSFGKISASQQKQGASSKRRQGQLQLQPRSQQDRHSLRQSNRCRQIRESCLMSGHYLAFLCGLAAALVALLLLCLLRRGGAIDSLLLNGNSEAKPASILSRAAADWSALSSRQAERLNRPEFLGRLKKDSRTEASRLLQLVSRFAFDWKFLDSAYSAQACRLAPPGSPEAASLCSGPDDGLADASISARLLRFDDRVCNFLPVSGKNISSSATDDPSSPLSSLHLLASSSRSAVQMVSTVVLAALLLAACVHAFASLLFATVDAAGGFDYEPLADEAGLQGQQQQQQQQQLLRLLPTPPPGYDVFGRRTPPEAPAVASTGRLATVQQQQQQQHHQHQYSSLRHRTISTALPEIEESHV
ncbi:hypothetical protein BOX15_Mlig001903g9 [Macrostomum lignano]|uniref:EGF-like domain-containing protein n=2 Tax=Macrostomum lignano TaxID=282301 RepID=A0A267DJG3_9PLAT|nr:hypothetical protein BOX15_Mlig001903g9 [Macrostomum lignano]